MTFEIKKTDGATVITLNGRLDTTTAPILEKTIIEGVTEDAALVLDLKELVYISSAGLRVLLSTQKRMQKSGSMKLINVCAEVMEVFEMTGFADILQIQ